MFVFLSKFLPLLFYPISLIFLLTILALLTQSQPRRQRVVLITALLILWLASNRWAAYSLARSLEWRYLPPDHISSAEVIIVLGGGTEPAQYPRPAVELNSAGDRVIFAYRLYQQGLAKHILVSGGNISWLNSNDSTPAADMASILNDLGVPPDAIWMETTSRNTYENALYSRLFLDKLGIHHIILVTSAMHMPRAMGVFQQQGFEVTPAPTDYRITQTNWQRLWEADWAAQWINFYPSVGNMSMLTECLKEYFGIVVYRLQGWL